MSQVGPCQQHGVAIVQATAPDMKTKTCVKLDKNITTDNVMCLQYASNNGIIISMHIKGKIKKLHFKNFHLI